MMYYGFGGNWPGGPGWGLSMLLYMIIPVAVLVGLIFLAFYLWDRRNKIVLGAGSEPLDIVKQRYARGEITGEEFQRLKDELCRQ
ncbi:SHOCT domain-containing protein [Desulfotomaculum copahuensis]|uniref:SHOCT domain-containing protein n=1 Tax=Desulfotomaculum copahuensis TaxID=1838280 RepID=A0A1B7LDC4_9FIRM|nr:SHOCT domain-containing protein [Desulfotomaculum copahuensis]OAT81066.1 hypothetical protein A6M21_12125 [Desulfotomaculum copahuensis]